MLTTCKVTLLNVNGTTEDIFILAVSNLRIFFTTGQEMDSLTVPKNIHQNSGKYSIGNGSSSSDIQAKIVPWLDENFLSNCSDFRLLLYASFTCSESGRTVGLTLNKKMNKHIADLQQYIKIASMPSIYYSPFFEDCKDVYNEKCQDFKAMLDQLETCESRHDAANYQ